LWDRNEQNMLKTIYNTISSAVKNFEFRTARTYVPL
jgi:hypothetical protein